MYMFEWHTTHGHNHKQCKSMLNRATHDNTKKAETHIGTMNLNGHWNRWPMVLFKKSSPSHNGVSVWLNQVTTQVNHGKGFYSIICNFLYMYQSLNEGFTPLSIPTRAYAFFTSCLGVLSILSCSLLPWPWQNISVSVINFYFIFFLYNAKILDFYQI